MCLLYIQVSLLSVYVRLVFNSRQSDRRVVSVLFCQAEDGIRDLVRSRGLGDVYKRQFYKILRFEKDYLKWSYSNSNFTVTFPDPNAAVRPVSYTHLTLPTSDLV